MQTIYMAYAERLQRFLLRLTLGNREAAEDLLQETLLRVWRNIDQLPSDPANLQPWLFTVARNVAIDKARARQARPTEVAMTDSTRTPDVGDAVDRLVNVMAVRKALLELSPKHREILVELYYRGASAAEAAARIGIPEGTVKSRVHYALLALRAALGSNEVE